MTKTAPVTELARAKVNLALHVTGRRADGYHLLDSFVVFAELGDRVEVEPAATTSLTLDGPFGWDLSAGPDNLVLQAAALLPGGAAIRLLKNLPLAGGIGGGSADAAATLRALARLKGVALPPPDDVLGLGADVPVCLQSIPARMRGIGERLDPLPALPPLWIVLANPGVACPTGEIFRSMGPPPGKPMPDPPAFPEARALIAYLETTKNDLEGPAEALVPEVREAKAALAAQTGCLLARMSGSGATVFGLFTEKDPALAAAATLRDARPAWWVAAAPVAG